MHNLACAVHFNGKTINVPQPIYDAFFTTLAECKKRNVPDSRWFPEIIRTDDPPPTFHEDTLIRYGEREHLDALVTGVISFGPAESYIGAKLESQKDDETRRHHRRPNQVITIGGVQYPASEIKISYDIAETNAAPIPYHILCTSSEESLKLNRAFNAEGFVKIRRPREFLELARVALKQVSPTADLAMENVRYYDDLSERPDRMLDELIRSKTIEYSYQWETRFSVLNGPTPGKRFGIKIEPTDGLFELVPIPKTAVPDR
jgi:hypothetical protein